MSDSWSPAFQRQILAAAISGTLLSKIPLDPALFGSATDNAIAVSPRMRIATAVVEYWDTYHAAPAEHIEQVLADAAATLQPEERRGLEAEAAEILALGAVAVKPFMRDKVAAKMKHQRMKQAIWQASGLVNAGLEGMTDAEAVLTKAMEPIAVDGPDDRLMTGAEIRARYGQKEFLVENMLILGDLSVLAAQPGVGKSTLTANLAYSVHTGRPFLGRAVTQGLVIILAFEGVTSTLAVLEALGYDLASDGILFWIGAGNPQDPATWLQSVVGEREPVLIIADTLTDFSSSQHGASNSGYEEITGKLGAVYRWAQGRRCHFLANHHSTTKRELDGLDAVLGSTGIVAKPGTVLILKRDRKGSEVRVLMGRKHRETPEDYPLTVLAFDPTTKRLTAAGSRAEYTFRECGADIVRVIEEHGRTMAWKDLMAPGVIGGRKEVKLAALEALTRRGLLTESGKAKSRTDPLTLSVAPGVLRPRDQWRVFSMPGTKSSEANSAKEKAS